jgi:hypothetical protein
VNLLFIPILLLSFSSLFPMANGFDSKDIAATLSLYEHQSELVSRFKELESNVPSGTIVLDSESINRDCALAVLHKQEYGYDLEINGHREPIYNHLINKELRELHPDKLQQLLASHDASLYVNQTEDGQLTLDIQGRLEGGKAIGAMLGFAFGGAIVYIPGKISLFIGRIYARKTGGDAGEFVYQETVERVAEPTLRAAARASAMRWALRWGILLPF